VTDEDLIGCWSDDNLHLGTMEATDLVFMADGVGWSVLSNLGGCEQTLFRWSVRNHRLVLDETRYAYLEVRIDGLTLVDEKDWAKTIETGYVIRPGHDVVGDSVTMLELDQRGLFHRSIRTSSA
jgi:hypothetical protein